MRKLTSKGKHTVKLRSHPLTNVVSKRETDKRKLQMKDVGNAFEIKSPAT